MVESIDLKKQLQFLYKPSAKQPEIVEVPPLSFLMIDGAGDPNTAQEYQEAVDALYSSAYTIKFAFKKRRGIDFPVMALEGLWWVEDLAAFSYDHRADWRWTMMIMQPEVVMQEDLLAAAEELSGKKALPALERIRLEAYHEGASAQIMHMGPYSAELSTVERLHRFITGQGCEPRGRHHEIYLGDPRRSAPEKLKTILRQPVQGVS